MRFLMLIAVSSFGESLRRVLLTAPAEAVLTTQSLNFPTHSFLTAASQRSDLRPLHSAYGGGRG
jgi:hypothetical protein